MDVTQKTCSVNTTKMSNLKLKNLTDKFVDLFGYAPKSFRAGRFGARMDVECLERLGYTHTPV